jgi:cytochrome c5
MRTTSLAVSRLTALVLSAAAAFGCGFPPAGGVPPPLTAAAADAAKVRFPDASETSLGAGRDLFASHCNACHQYPDISKIEDSRWPDIVPRMGKKASLDDAQSHEVLLFILVARSPSAR